ncbi:MAG: exosortase/archaeosortase family protein [Acidobacteriota bacterium]
MAAPDISTPNQVAGSPLSRFPWPAIAWFGALLVVSYAPVLVRMFRQWMDDPDMGHGIFVPLVAAYMIWGKRQEVLAEPVSGNWWGLAVVGYGALQLVIATLGAELFLARTAFVISIIGAVLLLGGTRVARQLAFPLALLFFMVPLPAIIFNQLTLPLQLLASRVAEVSLNLLGFPVLREGNILELASQRLSVAEACSGIRSLLSLTFLSLVYGYLFERKLWMRGALLVAAVPIAIVANSLRVTVSGILAEYNKEWAEGLFHLAEGWVIFLLALVMLVVTHQLFNKVYSYARAKS